MGRIVHSVFKREQTYCKNVVYPMEVGRAPKTEGRKPDKRARQRRAYGPAGGSDGGTEGPPGSVIKDNEYHFLSCFPVAVQNGHPIDLPLEWEGQAVVGGAAGSF